MLIGSQQMTEEEIKRYKYAYGQQRRDAAQRGIPFKISWDEWFDLWLASGQLANRGRCLGQFVMARKGDEGAYEIGNVGIISCSANHRDAAPKMRGLIRSAEHCRNMSLAKKGKPPTPLQLAHLQSTWDASRGVPRGPMPEETRRKLSAALKGKKGPVISPEGKKRISESKKRYWAAQRVIRMGQK